MIDSDARMQGLHLHPQDFQPCPLSLAADEDNQLLTNPLDGSNQIHLFAAYGNQQGRCNQTEQQSIQ